MQGRYLLSLAPRTMTTLAYNCRPITRPATIQPQGSYCEIKVVYSYNRSIDNLIKSGYLIPALKLFEEIPLRDVRTWNILISGCGRYGFSSKALCLYSQMIFQGFRESSSTFSSVLSTCADAGFYRQGLQVQSRVIILGLSINPYVAGALINLYMHLGLVDVALRLFDDLPVRNLAIWNLVLRGLCELGRINDLLGLYNVMKVEDAEPNALTFCYLIRGCGVEMFLDEGKQLHCSVIKNGWLESNLFVANALVDFYSACGNVPDARKTYEAISPGNVISWNSIVSVYAGNGLLPEALESFHKMQSWGKRPSVRSFVGLLNLSSRSKNIQLGKLIHCYVLKSGFDHESIYLQSALIDMYGKCGEIESSVSIFASLPDRTLECCNSLMTTFMHCRVIEDVIEMFGLMVDECIGFDEVSLSATLRALSMSEFTSLASCKLLHCCAIKSGLESDLAVSCSLIDSYSRSGHVELSHEIFSNLSSPNSICFTSIISAYARNGMGMEGLEMLALMVEKGLKPDKVTFLCVLMGCSHSGLVREGSQVFESMESLHGVHPDRQHYSCMVDLFGRAGELDKAEELLRQAVAKDDVVMWSSLLMSCRIHRNAEVGRRVAEKLMDLECEDLAVWLQASKFYAEIGDFEISLQIKEIAVARKFQRDIGYSLIEVNAI